MQYKCTLFLNGRNTYQHWRPQTDDRRKTIDSKAGYISNVLICVTNHLYRQRMEQDSLYLRQRTDRLLQYRKH